MRKIVFSLLVIVFIVGGIFVLTEYQKIRAVQKLDIRVDSVSVDEVGVSGAKIGFVVVFRNPNSIEVTTGNINADVFANGVHVADVQFDPIVLAPGEVLETSSHLSINYADVGPSLLQSFMEGNLVWNVKGEYTLLLPFGFEYKSEFEL